MTYSKKRALSYGVILISVLLAYFCRQEMCIRDSSRSYSKIAMTANAFEEDRKKAIKAGMNAHIAKPISVDTVSYTHL